MSMTITLLLGEKVARRLLRLKDSIGAKDVGEVISTALAITEKLNEETRIRGNTVLIKCRQSGEYEEFVVEKDPC